MFIYENLKNRFFRKKFKKDFVLQRRACTQIENFKCNYLENYNDSEHVVKTKHALNFINFLNIKKPTFSPLDWSFKALLHQQKNLGLQVTVLEDFEIKVCKVG